MYEEAYAEGRTFEAFMVGVAANRHLWEALRARARVDAASLQRARSLEGRWRLLALADDWCGDAVNILPVVARLVDEMQDVEMRILGRDEHPGLMERHLTGGSRSIPVFILLDEAGRCRGWWGPRPSELQAWFEAEGRALPTTERYRELRRWYARDRGSAIVREVLDLLQHCGAEGGAEPCLDARPCADAQAAA